jgi:hypothetical protein
LGSKFKAFVYKKSMGKRMDISVITAIPIIGIITLLLTVYFGFYDRLTRPKLKISGYNKKPESDGMYYYAEITKKGKKSASECGAEIEVNGSRYKGQWSETFGENKIDIHTSEKLSLFYVDEINKMIIFPTIPTPSDKGWPLANYNDKILKIVVFSKNATQASDKKKISEIMQRAKTSN